MKVDDLLSGGFFDDVEFVFPSRMPRKQQAIDMSQISSFYIGSKSIEEVRQLTRSDLFNPNLTAESDYRGNTGFDFIGDMTYNCRSEMLMDLAVLDKQEYKWNISEFGMSIANLEPSKVLSACRQIRNAFPSGNIMSKRYYTQGTGTAAYKFDFGDPVRKRLGIFFGVDSPLSNAYRNKLVKFCVGDVKTPNNFFKKGKIKDWRQFITPDVKVIYSNVSKWGDEGMVVDKELHDIHRDIIDSGYELIYKHHLELPLLGSVIDWKKPRPHNMEVILRVVKGPGVGVDLDMLLQETVRVNIERTKTMLSRSYKFRFPDGFNPDKLGFVHGESRGIGLLVKRKGNDRFAFMNSRFGKADQLRFKALCMDRDAVLLTTRLNLLKVSFEFPVILQDMPVAISNVKLFFFLSVLHFTKKAGRKLSFDEEFGYYVE